MDYSYFFLPLQLLSNKLHSIICTSGGLHLYICVMQIRSITQGFNFHLEMNTELKLIYLCILIQKWSTTLLKNGKYFPDLVKILRFFLNGNLGQFASYSWVSVSNKLMSSVESRIFSCYQYEEDGTFRSLNFKLLCGVQWTPTTFQRLWEWNGR